jgi:hypothetical protein
MGSASAGMSKKRAKAFVKLEARYGRWDYSDPCDRKSGVERKFNADMAKLLASAEDASMWKTAAILVEVAYWQNVYQNAIYPDFPKRVTEKNKHKMEGYQDLLKCKENQKKAAPKSEPEPPPRKKRRAPRTDVMTMGPRPGRLTGGTPIASAKPAVELWQLAAGALVLYLAAR